MFIFDSCSCPKCNKSASFGLDADLTLKEFEKEYDSGAMLILDMQNPPSYPDYLIFSCSNAECQHREKFTDQQAIEFVRKSLAKTAWQIWQRSISTATDFEGMFTRFIYENDLGKFVTEKELLENPLIRDFLKASKTK